MTSRPVEVVVVGGGPAGAAAARLLSGWGHSVLMLPGPVASRRSLAESLPPSCDKLFDLLGARPALDTAGFLASTGNTVRWAGGETRAATFADGRTGLQVERAAFDAVLRRLAADAGAQLEDGSLVRDVRLAPSDASPGAAATLVDYTAATGVHRQVEAAFVLDCTGRAGVVARRGFRVADSGHRTLALTAVWTRDDGWGLDDASHTVVETYGDGWAWSVPVTPERRYVTVMVDPEVTDSGSAHGLDTRYTAELAKTVALGRLVAGAIRATPAWGCDASLYHAPVCGGPGLLLVGDAVSFIDPLSSHGVKKALASAWLAAVTVHTSLGNSALAGVALDLFNEREREMHAAARRQSTRFFADAARHHLHPFWTGRAEGDSLEQPEPGADATIERLRENPAVLAALDTLRQASDLRLRRGERLQIETRPALTTREVVLQDRLVLPAWPADGHGIRYLRDVDLVRLVELAPDHRQVPALFEAYNCACPPVGLPDFLGALSVLLAKGALAWDL